LAEKCVVEVWVVEAAKGDGDRNEGRLVEEENWGNGDRNGGLGIRMWRMGVCCCGMKRDLFNGVVG